MLSRQAEVNMEDNKYTRLFRMLNIPVEPMPENYTPESFAEQLKKGYPERDPVTYSASSNADIEGLKYSVNTYASIK